MEYLVPGICGLLLILGLIGVVMSRNVWRIPQMLLVAGILISSAIFFWLAARTLKTHQGWQVLIASYQEALNQTEKGKFAGQQLVQRGIDQLRAERDDLDRKVAVAMANRGRVWHDAARVRVSSDTGAISAKVEEPSPSGIEKKMVLFVFDEQEKGGKYLGEFVVTNVNNATVDLVPSMQLVQSDLNLLTSSRGPWAFYEIMPTDSHSLFAQVQDPAQLKSMLPDSANKEQPQEVREEYTNDGKPLDPKDPDKTYVRSLRDYAPIFRAAYRERNRLFSEKNDLAAEATLVETAVAGVQEDVAAAKAENADLGKDLQNFKSDRDAVAAYASAISKRIEQLRVQLSQAFRSNIALATELAQIQRRLVDEANRRHPPGQASDLRSLMRQ